MLRDCRAESAGRLEPLFKAFLLLALQPGTLRTWSLPERMPRGTCCSRRCFPLDDAFAAAPTPADDICFWLYSSGFDRGAQGPVHLHSHLVLTADLYAIPVLGIRESDVVFFRGEAVLRLRPRQRADLPAAVGATTVLMAERPTPDSVFKRLVEHKATTFYGVPTLYAAMLGESTFPAKRTPSSCAWAPPRARRCRPRSSGASARRPTSNCSTA